MTSRSAGGPDVDLLDFAVQSRAPQMKRVCRIKVIHDGAIPFEEQQWTRMPRLASKDDASAVYQRRLKHNFPCLPSTFQGQDAPPPAVLSARSAGDACSSWR